MINRILHSCSCIIEFIKLVGEKPIRCSAEPRILSFPSTRLINSIVHEHSYKILYLVHEFPALRIIILTQQVTALEYIPECRTATCLTCQSRAQFTIPDRRTESRVEERYTIIFDYHFKMPYNPRVTKERFTSAQVQNSCSSLLDKPETLRGLSPKFVDNA